jgi:transcriptional regulator with XRE-family HTH domain
MTGRPQSPTFARRQVAGILRILRERRGLVQADVGKRLEKPHTFVSKIERAEQKLQQAQLEVLLGFYEVAPELTEALLEMNRKASQRAWWREFRGVINEEFGQYLGLETDAEHIRNWECQALPGLLQTEAYARALMEHSVRRDDELAKRVALRLARQDVLMGPNPPTFHAVVSEGALRQEVGGLEVWREQLDKVFKMSELRNITFQVVPFRTGAHSGFSGSFSLLSFRPLPPPFEEASADAVASQDNLLGVVTHDQPSQTEAYKRVWEGICAEALPPDESRQMIHRIAQGQPA